MTKWATSPTPASGDMYLKTAFYLLPFAVIFLNKTDVLFLLFRFVFLTIRGRINNSMGIYNNCNMLFLALPTPFPQPLPLYEFLLTLMKRKFHA